MRVIAGEFRSRRLKSLAGLDTRPTPDRLRESLFSILEPQIKGAVFVDAYAGTGAVGIEALSRGASRAIFLERNPAAIAVIEDNLHSLGVGSKGRVVKGRVVTALRQHAAGAAIVFLDPPYELDAEYQDSLDWLGQHPPSGMVIVQHHPKRVLPETAGALHRYRELRQGDNQLSFYSVPTRARPD